MNTELPTLTPETVQRAIANGQRLRSEAIVGMFKTIFRAVASLRARTGNTVTLRPRTA